MKITKRQLKAVLNVAYEAGFNYRDENFSMGNFKEIAGETDLDDGRDKVVKRIAKHEVKHAKMRKLKNVRKHWNVNLADHEKARGKNYVAAGCGLWSMQGELGAGKSATLPDLLAEHDFEGMDSAQVYASLDPTSTTSDNNESNASKLNETPTKEDV
jgi:hypothetical protein